MCSREPGLYLFMLFYQLFPRSEMFAKELILKTHSKKGSYFVVISEFSSILWCNMLIR